MTLTTLARTYLALLSIVALYAPAPTVHAAGGPRLAPSIFDYDPREVAMLPEYCKYTQLFRSKVPGGLDQGRIHYWAERLGPTFAAMHHYCWGLMDTNRALLYARDAQHRRFYLSASIGEFDYLLRHASQDFVLLPEILTNRGRNLLRLGNAAQGLADLERAISAKADYWPPYAYIADFYKASGDSAKARETLEKGLKQTPGAKALERRLAALDAR